MTWTGILQSGEKIRRDHVTEGMEIAFSKSFIMNDFQDYLFEINKDNILDSLQKSAGSSPLRSLSLKMFIGFELEKVLTGLRTVSQSQYNWTDEQRQEVRDGLMILTEGCQQCIRDMQEFESIKNGNVKEHDYGSFASLRSAKQGGSI